MSTTKVTFVSSITKITVEKTFKQVNCGTSTSYQDEHGNTKYRADRVVDNQVFDFYDKGASEYWLRLGGLLHG